MNKIIATLFIGLFVFVPAFAEARSAPKDKTAPKTTAIHIQSNNTDPSKAKAGDTVTLTFTADEKVTPIVLVETKTLFVKAKNSSGNTWDATYTVNSKDRTGKVDYLITLVDAAGNVSICSSARILLIKQCPTTDGSSVTIYKATTPPPPPPVDTVAPVIAAHDDVSVTTEDDSAAVEYQLPTATDNVDSTVVVTCSPASGSTFALGETTVTCNAQDAAGNPAIPTTFTVTVEQELPQEPELYTMASQPDEDFFCAGTWRLCYINDPNFETSFVAIDLGQGSQMGEGVLQTVTIAKDENNNPDNFLHPWLITINCFVDAGHTSTCGGDPISGFASDSSDGKHWTANFASLNTTFNPAHYYQLVIDDTNWDAGAYGTPTEPYWVITGLR